MTDERASVSAHVDVTDATFETDVVERSRELPVVVDFWAAWCGPCKMVAPEMEKLAAKYDGAVDVVKVDVDANPRLSQAFNIMSIPTIAYFKPGAQPQGVVGFRPLEQLEQQFNLTEFAAVKASSRSSARAETCRRCCPRSRPEIRSEPSTPFSPGSRTQLPSGASGSARSQSPSSSISARTIRRRSRIAAVSQQLSTDAAPSGTCPPSRPWR
jgi:thioredoxin